MKIGINVSHRVSWRVIIYLDVHQWNQYYQNIDIFQIEDHRVSGDRVYQKRKRCLKIN